MGHCEPPDEPAGRLAGKEIFKMLVAETRPRPSVALPVTLIVAVSAAAVCFLLWLLYLHHPVDASSAHFRFLPALNAMLNGLCTIALMAGFYNIRLRNIPAHRLSMMIAFVFSSLFLLSYITNHALHGETHFPGSGTVRTIYLTILITHVSLSIVALPMVLTTFFFSLSGRFAQHRKLARFTLPIWLYVSVTGVVVYAMLAAWR
jgi:putative membrane protein